MNFRKKLQHNFPKMRGGGQRPFGTFPKIHPFWMCKASLRSVSNMNSLPKLKPTKPWSPIYCKWTLIWCILPVWGRQSTTLLLPLKLSRSNSVQHSFPPLHSHISDFIKISQRDKQKKTHCIPGHLADSNLVAEHFYWFSAVNHPPGAQQCGNNNLFELTLEMSRPPCRRTPWSPGGKPILL